MILEGIACAVLVGLLRGGKVKRLLDVRIFGFWLIAGGLLLRIALASFAAPSAVPSFVNIGGQTLAFALVGAGLWMNGRYLRLAALGVALNFLVIALNGGLMPVSKAALDALGHSYNPDCLATVEGRYALIDAGTRLPFLADIFVVPSVYPSYRILSIGDLLLFVGVFLFVQEVMLGSAEENDRQQSDPG